MQIFNNFITPKEQKELYDYVKSNKMPFRIYPTHIFQKNDPLEGKIHAPEQFSHFMYMHDEEKISPHMAILRPVFDKLQSVIGKITLFRAKVNLSLPYPGLNNYEPQVPHTDMAYDDGRKIPHQVFLYYINDSDGPTYFFNENGELTDAVEPRMGRGVLFDGSQLHAASNPIKYQFRFALNINFRKGLGQIP